MLFDRNGKVLVENQNTFNITLDREQAKGNLDETLHLLATATGADEARAHARRSTAGGASRATGRSS